MAHCPSCDFPLPDNRERLGARCPECRDPLYEPPGRIGRPARPGEASCAIHDGRESVGLCIRCGQQICEVCRTRWHGQILCAACVDRALPAIQAPLSGEPCQDREHALAHVRQARRALGLGGGAWLLSASALGVLHLAGSQPPVLLTFIVFMILAGDILVAALGVGQAVAALRSPGEWTTRAALGLLLGGLYVGAMLGAGTLYLWQA